MPRRVIRAVLLAGLAHCLAAADLGRAIRDLLDASPAARSAFWGIEIVDQESGKTVFELNADHFFVPASNAKLFTTALAMTRLGPDHRFRTAVRMDASGSIRLIGGGDPNLSNRAIPYRMGPASGNPLQAIEDLADQVVARGISRIAGDVIGDDSAYVWQPFPNGWAIDDPVWDYGAPASALTVNDNAFTLTLTAGAQEGDPVSVMLAPPLEFYAIDNRARTSSRTERRISVEREPGSRQLRIWGDVPPASVYTETLGIDDPALYAAMAFYDALARRGVNIAGRATACHLFPNQVTDLKRGQPQPDPDGTDLASRLSAPLLEDLRITDKVSQNLHAELLLRAVGQARRQVGSRQAGLEEMTAFLTEVGIDEDSYHFVDSSGLSRLDLVTPRAVTRLLRHMLATPEWQQLLPVGGEDGTLSARFGGTRAAGKIHAKTGSLSHVSALSGYAERRSGGLRTFSILVNNSGGRSSSEIRALIDRICILMVE